MRIYDYLLLNENQVIFVDVRHIHTLMMGLQQIFSVIYWEEVSVQKKINANSMFNSFGLSLDHNASFHV